MWVLLAYAMAIPLIFAGGVAWPRWRRVLFGVGVGAIVLPVLAAMGLFVYLFVALQGPVVHFG
jgi:ABC-type tungstate transport system substrate-binding protein